MTHTANGQLPTGQEDFGSADRASGAGDEKTDDAAKAKPKKFKIGPMMLAVLTEHGQQILAVHYPWKACTKPSVEVRLVPDKPAKPDNESKPAKLNEVKANEPPVPTYFVGQFMKGDKEDKVYEILTQASDRPHDWSFTQDKTVYRVVGTKNLLGMGAVHVLSYPEDSTPDKSPAATFLELSSWAIDNKKLSLELPRAAFSQSGTLHVWFLRGETVLWEDQVAWPGFK
jgi:hypothetical protein